MTMTLLLFILFTLVTLEVRGTGLDGDTKNVIPESTSPDSKCERKQNNCSECIQTLGCLWCKDKDIPLESRRCFSNNSQTTFQCADIENPQGKIQKISDDAEKVGKKESHKIRPQVVQLSLRKGEKFNVTLQYTDEKHRPLDIYILMDLSCSMKKHKDKVSTLASSLAENLKNLTSNLRIGFGSFVDKPLAPFGFLQPPKDISVSKCDGEPVKSLPYGFKNNLPLTQNITQFIEGVKSAGISSNVDFPEGTLDGLLQSIVCTQQIGWRSQKGNRKLLVISTDGNYHIAGDGKLVGVVLPHDGVCYVDGFGAYTHATILDYPSVSLVRQKIRENDIFVIFAVTEQQQNTYRKLSQQLHPFAVTQGIDNEDNSIASVIENQYKKLVNTVTLFSELNLPGYVGIKVYAQCPGEKEFYSNNQCNQVGPGVTVSFKVEVELKDCPLNTSNWNSNVTIYPHSSIDDKMVIELTMLCGCDCERINTNSIHLLNTDRSADCSGHGVLQCGICACDSKFGGPFCNCSLAENEHVDKDSCRDPKTGLVCNKRGKCDSCGKCVCDAAFGGKHCECDNTDCPLEPSDKGLCNENAHDGPHGHCECSICACKLEQYTGPRCECPISDETCRDIKTNKICNGVGKCECGQCNCEDANIGIFCEIQHAKLNGSCEVAQAETQKCVQCLLRRYGLEETDAEKQENCKENCEEEGISIVFQQRIDSIAIDEEEKVCKDFGVDDKKGCRVDYIIRQKDITTGKILLEIETGEIVLREKCPRPAPLFEIMIGIITAMVVIGVTLLLLWKLVTHIQDRREYERFEKAINEVSWNTHQNPLYKSTTSQFKNPVYEDFEEAETSS